MKRIEVKDGRFVAYLNLKYMHFDEKRHGNILKPNSVIRLRAQSAYIPDYENAGKAGRKV